ncbi:MAG: hypothetical protein JW849_10770 [Phycisphaerae bacterium]|nr:hypothetical protein [Phycisphaerae bacterium]
MRKTALLLCAMPLAAACLLAGCEEPVADEMAIQKTQSVLVVPFQSSASDPSAGPIAAGAAGTLLRKDLHASIRVRVAPVLWRINQPDRLGLDDAEAIQLARDLEVDSVLTGSVNLTLEHEKKGKTPEILKAGQVPSSSVPKGDVDVKLRLISIQSGKCIYEMTGRAGGDKPAKRMDDAVEKAVGPLVKFWNRGKKSWP